MISNPYPSPTITCHELPHFLSMASFIFLAAAYTLEYKLLHNFQDIFQSQSQLNLLPLIELLQTYHKTNTRQSHSTVLPLLMHMKNSFWNLFHLLLLHRLLLFLLNSHYFLYLPFNFFKENSPKMFIWMSECDLFNFNSMHGRS